MTNEIGNGWMIWDIWNGSNDKVAIVSNKYPDEKIWAHISNGKLTICRGQRYGRLNYAFDLEEERKELSEKLEKEYLRIKKGRDIVKALRTDKNVMIAHTGSADVPDVWIELKTMKNKYKIYDNTLSVGSFDKIDIKEKTVQEIINLIK